MFRWVLIVLLAIGLSGCAVNFYAGRPSDLNKIEKLGSDLELEKALREKERQELLAAKEMLERQLKKEIADKDIKLEMAERGLVITFVDKILFDSGKAQLKEGANSTLQKVANVLKTRLGGRHIAIEGHTDNEPIKYSGWKSNWELSTSRATSVLHYLIDEGKIEPDMLSARGYGEYKPVASNKTPEGKSQNRRVEVVIVPKEITKADIREARKEQEQELK